jgi:hypothetical protein
VSGPTPNLSPAGMAKLTLENSEKARDATELALHVQEERLVVEKRRMRLQLVTLVLVTVAAAFGVVDIILTLVRR